MSGREIGDEGLVGDRLDLDGRCAELEDLGHAAHHLGVVDPQAAGPARGVEAAVAKDRVGSRRVSDRDEGVEDGRVGATSIVNSSKWPPDRPPCGGRRGSGSGPRCPRWRGCRRRDRARRSCVVGGVGSQSILPGPTRASRCELAADDVRGRLGHGPQRGGLAPEIVTKPSTAVGGVVEALEGPAQLAPGGRPRSPMSGGRPTRWRGRRRPRFAGIIAEPSLIIIATWSAGTSDGRGRRRARSSCR